MRIKVTVSGVPIELETDSKEEFRDALEVVVATFGGFKTPPYNASFRESETKSEAVEVIRTSPPVTEDAPGGVSYPLNRTLDYRKAKTIVQHLLIALKDLGELHGTDRHYSNNTILDHLQVTGAATRLFTKKKAKPIGIVGQAARDATANGLLVRVEDEHGDLEGYMLKEWVKDDMQLGTQQEVNEETALEPQSPEL